MQHNGWWRPGQRANITRRSVGDPEGDIRPNRTEDLDQLTDSMLRYGYPGFEHNYGLWYDRRRDAHDAGRRTDPNVVPPFLEQPWARIAESGPPEEAAWDGLPKYDLEQFNPWYFERLKAFADLCDAKGTVLFHKFYMQHNVLETPAHYVDFAWRPTNCIQDTEMPDRLPAANVFYDISHPERRRLHRAYIRKCLDVLGDNRNVVHLTSQEYTGPRDFVAFWIDTILEWERETGKDIHIGLGAPKDVQDSILADSTRGPAIDTIDMRYWWQRANGTLFAPDGGNQLPGRGIESGGKQSEESSPESLYAKVRAYRERYPEKALLDAVNASRQQCWAFLMAGGGMLVRGQICYPDYVDPPEYIQPAGVEIILPTYAFIREHLAEPLLDMQPTRRVVDSPSDVWCLADADASALLVYSLNGKAFALDLTDGPQELTAQWFDPRNGELSPAHEGAVAGGKNVSFTPPTSDDWALWVTGQ